MCRLYGFLANEPSKVDCSLVFAQNALLLQSRVDEVGRNHADGWGIATYQQGTPRLIKKTTAAFDDQSFSGEAEKIYTTAAIAHVRKATVGSPSEFNTHPFRIGNWVFAHNGTLTGFKKIESQLIQETLPDLQKHRQGATDSEQYFLWLVSHLRKMNFVDHRASPIQPADRVGVDSYLQRLVAHLDRRCREAAANRVPKLNFLLTDGQFMVACRWNNSLHMIERNGIYDCQICGVPHIHHHETIRHQAVAFASEPITSEDWNEVANKSLVATALPARSGSGLGT